jgi:segregation and condensation protein B
MNETDLKLVIEATLLAAGRPVTTQQLLDLFDERERPTPEQLQAAMDLLVQDYATRGIELLEVASGWRIQVRPRFADMVSRLWQERPSRYSRALLETLALIAYRQPITRSEIEEIRGVSISSTIMRTLQERNWIRTVGHREVPGRPELLGTTREFLDYFGLKSLDQLPTLAELKDVETIGVQLELPSGEAPAAESAAAPEAGAGETAESNGEAAMASAEADTETSDTDAESSGSSEGSGEGDESELSAAGEDADDDEDSDASPTMVASEDEEERGTIGDPPDERRED